MQSSEEAKAGKAMPTARRLSGCARAPVTHLRDTLRGDGPGRLLRGAPCQGRRWLLLMHGVSLRFRGVVDGKPMRRVVPSASSGHPPPLGLPPPRAVAHMSTKKSHHARWLVCRGHGGRDSQQAVAGERARGQDERSSHRSRP